MLSDHEKRKRRVEELYGDKHTCSFELRKFGGPIFALPYSFFCMGYIFRVCCLSPSLSLFPCNLFVCLHIFTEMEKAPRREKLFLSRRHRSDVLAKRRKHIFVYDSLRHRNSLFLLKLRAPEEKCERFFFFSTSKPEVV